MSAPTSLPIARLRAAGCRVATTYAHDPRGAWWSYVVTPTGPAASDVRIAAAQAGHTATADGMGVWIAGSQVARVTGSLSTLADMVTDLGDVTTPTGSGSAADEEEDTDWCDECEGTRDLTPGPRHAPTCSEYVPQDDAPTCPCALP